MYQLDRQAFGRYYRQLVKNNRHVRSTGYTMGPMEFLKAQIVKESLPGLLLTSESKTFGNPDSHYQGGIFIQIRSGSVTKPFHVETGLEQVPGELRKYATLIMSITGFKNL